MPSAQQDVSASEAKEAIDEHLEQICSSRIFAASRRCQDFLRYLVNEAVAGRGDLVSERSIAQAVFGKGDNFQPDEFSLVRVKASEVRKRLADFYDHQPETDIRIEFPNRSYAVRLHALKNGSAAALPKVKSQEDAQFEDGVGVEFTKNVSRRRLLWSMAGITGVSAVTGVASWWFAGRSPMQRLWKPVFDTNSSLLVYIPVIHLHDQDNSATEWVGIGPSTALNRAAVFLIKGHHPYSVRYGDELTFSQLKEQPCLWLGGFGSQRNFQMLRDLRFAFSIDAETGLRQVVDTKTNRQWKEIWTNPHSYVDVDYGVLTRLIHSETGQVLMAAVGTQTFGTAGAAEILFDPEIFNVFIKQAPFNWEILNFQIVIKVKVMGTTVSSPSFVDAHFW